jgi:ABC-2 type transport system ATP-binding protein
VAQFGYLPQEPAFYKWMTPRDYLHYVAAMFFLPAAQRKRRVEEMLELVGLQEASRRRIGGFSGGMKQRLGIAQALIHEPPVLLLDEPTSALDPAGRYEILQLIDGLRGRVTVFFSSHILGDVERVCDTIGIIHDGELLTVAARDESAGRLRHQYLAPGSGARLSAAACQLYGRIGSAAVAGQTDPGR